MQIETGSRMNKRLRLGDILVQEGYVQEAQIEEALNIQKERGTNLRVGELLLDLGLVTQDQVMSALSRRLQLQVVNLEDQTVDFNAVELIPESLCLKYKVIAFRAVNHVVDIAVADPLDLYALEDIKTMINGTANIIIGREDQIVREVNKAYATINAKKAAAKASETIEKTETTVSITEGEQDSPVISLINSIIVKAHSEGSSDVHFEPFEHKISIRLRIDGQLIDHIEIDEVLGPQVATRLKIVSGLDIAEKRIPQDGNFRMKVGGEDVSVRVSSIPTIYGEKLVLRFLSQARELDNAQTYGMNEENYSKIQRILQNPHGIVFITGPTGSGKTTTLYMMLERMSKQKINIATIEDPVERGLERVNQTQVNVQAGLTFDAGLRSLLRQDPDVILVGETRDSETASVAVSAALTGHLVFSTLHTNDSVRAIIRLIDMGIEGYMVANSLVGVVAQRLIKKVCPYCREEYKPSERELQFVPEGTRLFRGRGCVHCNNSGYRGRLAVHEILEIDTHMRKMITNGESTEAIFEYAIKDGGLKIIGDQVLELVLQGVTTVEEFLKQSAFAGSN